MAPGWVDHNFLFLKKIGPSRLLSSGQWLIVILKAGLDALLGQFIAICLFASMKNLLLAAALLTTAAPAMANPVHLFSINTTNPRSIDFKGTGTANFNNSTGTQNNFNVGSSTNLGVSGSINSTRDYGGTSDGSLQLAGTSVMQQTIGTSGNAANVQAASQAAGLAAYTSANQFAKTLTESNFGTSYDISKVGVTDASGNITNMSEDLYRKADGSVLTVNDIASATDWQNAKEEFERQKFDTQYASDYATTLEQSQMVGTWKYDATRTQLMALEQADRGNFKGSYSQYESYFETLDDAGKIDAAGDGAASAASDNTITKLTREQWETGKAKFIDNIALNNKVNQSGVSLAEFVGASGESSSSESEQFGVIKGDFKTNNRAYLGSPGTHTEWIAAARTAADSALGANFDASKLYDASQSEADNVAAGNYASTITSADDWSTAWNASFESNYNDSQSNTAFNSSESTVTVTGVGNIANVNASGQSKFNVKLTPREIPTYETQVAAFNGKILDPSGNVQTLGDTPTSVGVDKLMIFPEENGSASGSSGANLATSSYANQSNSENASAFIQAFAASNSPALLTNQIGTATVDPNATTN